MIRKIARFLNIDHIGFMIDLNAVLFGIKFIPAECTCVFDRETDEPIEVDTLAFMFGPFVMMVVFGGEK